MFRVVEEQIFLGRLNIQTRISLLGTDFLGSRKDNAYNGKRRATKMYEELGRAEVHMREKL
jgi:hypothetical protein